jgi:asparaginyl-tRNA synthetase
MAEEKLKPDDYKWYVELRRYGTVPHSGFGMGIERTLAWICKLEHIRDSIAFPRLINRVYP